MSDGFKVLIIDDNEFDRVLCGHMLEQAASTQEIHSAASCREGLAVLAERTDIDCILLDLRLPDGLGSDRIAEIHEYCPNAAVIMLTGEADQRTALDCLKKGADDYLVKGEYTGAILDRTLRYATARRRAYLHAQELSLALKRQQELNEIQQEFICLVAHEFKTPLGIISGAVQLLEAGSAPSALLERQSKKINSSIKRLSGLMDNVLLLRKVEDRQLAGETTRFDLISTLQSVCEYASDDHSDARIVFHSAVAQLEVAGNHTLCEYAVSNIIKNAIKYSTPEAPVEVHVAHNDTFASIRVCDHGRGMNNETLTRVGERFMRGKGSFSQPGIGLGLYLATQFTTHNGGALYICSEEGQGTTVMLKWPLAIATQQQTRRAG